MKIIRPMDINDPALVTSNVPETDYAAYNAATTYALGDRVIVASPSAVVTMTIGSPCVVTWPAHGFPVLTPMVFSTTGVLPPQITPSAAYYLQATATDTFTLSATPNGPAINTTGPQSGVHTATASTHRVYEALQAANIGHTPRSEPTWWLDVGATNAWLMFDQSVTSQTSNPDSIVVDILLNGLADSVALLNISAATARFQMVDAIDGVVYDQTRSLVSTNGINDWYDYYFEPVVRITDWVESGMPPYLNALLTITLSDAGNTVLSGACVVGQQRDMGDNQYGASLGIQDYSVKQRDAFGNYSILERAFNKTAKFTVWVDNIDLDSFQSILAKCRATPIVYIGSDRYGCSIVYGFYKDFSTVISYPNYSICDIDLEGLT